MIAPLAALTLLSFSSSAVDAAAAEEAARVSLVAAEPGADLTLTCPVRGDESSLFYWHKLSSGSTLQTVALGSFGQIKLREPFLNSRFSVAQDERLYLNIRNVSEEDEATYFCQTGSAYEMSFISGFHLAVNAPKNLQNSFYVKQTPESDSVRSGESTNLRCSLLSKKTENKDQSPAEHSVFWFRAGSGESHPSIIYPQKNRSDGGEERSCVYSLSRTLQDSSDAGTYYCAVVTCGEILFGGGTKVEIRQDGVVRVLVALLACCVMVIAALIFFMVRKPSCHKGGFAASSPAENERSAPSHVDGEAEALNYVALDFSARKHKSLRYKSEIQDCLYSDTRK